MTRFASFLLLLLAPALAVAQVSPQPANQFWATPSATTGYLDLRLGTALTPSFGAKTTVGSVGWLEPIIGSTESIAALTALSPIGFIGSLGACRTSDSTAAGAQGCQGGSFHTINNNATQVQSGYSVYMEARRSAGAGTTHGLEADVLNYGSNVAINPYAMGATGQTMAAWLTAGRPDEPTATGGISTAIGVLNNGAPFLEGMIFHSTSIFGTDGATGVGIAIDMARGHEIVWRNPGTPSVLSGIIRSDVSTGAAAQGVVFSDSGLVISDTIGASNMAIFAPTAIHLYKTVDFAYAGGATCTITGSIDVMINGAAKKIPYC